MNILSMPDSHSIIISLLVIVVIIIIYMLYSQSQAVAAVNMASASVPPVVVASTPAAFTVNRAMLAPILTPFRRTSAVAPPSPINMVNLSHRM